MDEEIVIPRSENEAAAELERIFSEAVLAVSRGPGAGPRCGVVAAEKMQQVRRFQAQGTVSDPLGIDEQGKSNIGLFAKQAGKVPVAQPDRCERCSGLLESVFVSAQLRDMLAAEDSSVVPQEDNNGRTALPQRAQADLATPSFGQDNIGELCAEGFRHAPIVADCHGRLGIPGKTQGGPISTIRTSLSSLRHVFANGGPG